LRLSVLILLATLAAPHARAQAPGPPTPAPAPTVPSHATPAPAHIRAHLIPKPAPFSSAGLPHQDDLLRIYTGDFASIQFARNTPDTLALLSGYINAYAAACPQLLPAEKVQVTRTECVQVAQTVNPDGSPAGPKSCTEVQAVPTGLFADPALFASSQALESTLRSNLAAALASKPPANPPGTPIGAPPTLVTPAQLDAATAEMTSLLQLDPCGSPALTAFQANLLHFANGEPPIRNPAPPPSAAPLPAPVAPLPTPATSTTPPAALPPH